MRAWSTIASEPVIMEKDKGGKERMRGISIEEFRYVVGDYMVIEVVLTS